MTQTMTRKEESKEKAEHGEEGIIQGYTAAYWQNQEKNLTETKGSLSIWFHVVKIPRNG